MSGDCPVCETPLTSAIVVGTKARHGYDSRRVACRGCGLVQVHPQPDLSDYYASGQYRRDYGEAAMILVSADGTQRTVQPGHPEHERAKRRLGELQAEWVEQAAGPLADKRLLEVGSGPGYVLAELRTRAEFALGVEPDSDLARKSDAWCGDLATFATKCRGPFDVVCSFHVLEHVPDPVSWLRTAASLLAPGGVVCVEVPDVLAPVLPLDSNHFQHVHLFDFSRHTLEALAARAGLEAVSVESARPGASFVRLVARPADGGVVWSVPFGGEAVAGFLAGVRWASK